MLAARAAVAIVSTVAVVAAAATSAVAAAGSGFGGGGGGGGTDFCADSIASCNVSSGAGTQAAAGSGTGDAQVTITYTPPLTVLAATLVADSIGQGPGHALADKATAIQTAVSAGQSTIACADITNYLGLVKAQTGKKLSPANAALLTSDATNLAAAIGC